MARDRLGDILIRAGLLDQAALKRALDEQRRWGGLLGHYLIELGLVSEENLVRALSTQYKLPAVALDPTKLDVNIAKLIPQRISERHRLLCFRVDRRNRILDVAMANPASVEAIDEVQLATQLTVRPHIAGPRTIDRAITYVYYGEVPLGAEIELMEPDTAPPPPALAPPVRHSPPPTEAIPELAGSVSLGEQAVTSSFHITMDLPPVEKEALDVHQRLRDLTAAIEHHTGVLEALLNTLISKNLLTGDEALGIISQDEE